MEEVVKFVIDEGTALKDKYVKDIPMSLDYVCIFCQNQKELQEFTAKVEKLGKVVKETETGNLYLINEKYPDENGTKIIKVRIPDETKKERGDLDFCIDDYGRYKEELLKLDCSKLIVRQDSEMIELMDKDFNARVYFSNPPVRKQLNLR